MTDRMIEYALMASVAILLVWLFLLLRREHLSRRADQLASLDELHPDPAPGSSAAKSKNKPFPSEV